MRRDIVVVGGSAGALEALKFAADLTPAFEAAIFVVIHVAPEGPGLLAELMGRYSALAVEYGSDGEPIRIGRIYVAPPDFHLIVRRAAMRVVRGPKENRHRPSIDVLFRSAAEAYGTRVIAVLLSGTMDDGVAGLLAVRAHGGIAIVQDPQDAEFPEMPRNALKGAGADHIVRWKQIGSVLEQLVARETPLASEKASGDHIDKETALESFDMKEIGSLEKPGVPSAFSCPDCGGVLWEIQDGDVLRFRCRVGHGLTAQSLLSAQSDNLENALWSALRALEEKAEFSRRLMEHSRQRNYASATATFEQQAKQIEAQAELIRRLLTGEKAEEERS